ncbi:hypothetical protein [Burkholderia ambifaria]|uniref:hypothetical protein n=1 Tax=Burkholderia ambifaria TaxID=152480 RepID=UPI002FDF602D
MENKPSIGPNRRYLRAHLAAKLFRLASVNHEGFEPVQLSNFQLIPKVTLTSFKSKDKSDTRTYSKITMFCGVFAKGLDYTTLPFIVSFNTRAGVPRASVGQFAIGCRVTTRERILAFMSVIDYLELSGDLPSGSLEDHARRITMSGKLSERAAIVDEYKEFCTRASRDLPYDDLIAA